MNRDVVAAMRQVLNPVVGVEIPGFEPTNNAMMIRLVTQMTYSAYLNARYSKARGR